MKWHHEYKDVLHSVTKQLEQVMSLRFVLFSDKQKGSTPFMPPASQTKTPIHTLGVSQYSPNGGMI